MIAPPSASQLRKAYTLLEMTLALAIALVILGAVYEFLNQQLRLTEIGRDVAEETALARRILDRMASDIVSSLGGVDPNLLPAASSDETEALLLAGTFTPLFNYGLEGDSGVLIIYAGRVPRELLASDKRAADSSTLENVSDLRRISYWLVEEGTAAGLARQEVTAVNGADFDTKPPEVDDVAKSVIAEEVKGLMFEYFDGAGWQSTWNGASMAADGQTPIGPPSAIRITLTLQRRGTDQTRDYKRVVAIPAGNNFPAQQSGY